VSLSPTFTSSFFVLKCFEQLFSNNSFCLVIFWQKNITPKAARKIGEIDYRLPPSSASAKMDFKVNLGLVNKLYRVHHELRLKSQFD